MSTVGGTSTQIGERVRRLGSAVRKAFTVMGSLDHCEHIQRFLLVRRLGSRRNSNASAL